MNSDLRESYQQTIDRLYELLDDLAEIVRRDFAAKVDQLTARALLEQLDAGRQYLHEAARDRHSPPPKRP